MNQNTWNLLSLRITRKKKRRKNNKTNNRDMCYEHLVTYFPYNFNEKKSHVNENTLPGFVIDYMHSSNFLSTSRKHQFFIGSLTFDFLILLLIWKLFWIYFIILTKKNYFILIIWVLLRKKKVEDRDNDEDEKRISKSCTDGADKNGQISQQDVAAIISLEENNKERVLWTGTGGVIF